MADRAALLKRVQELNQAVAEAATAASLSMRTDDADALHQVQAQLQDAYAALRDHDATVARRTAEAKVADAKARFGEAVAAAKARDPDGDVLVDDGVLTAKAALYRAHEEFIGVAA